MKKTVKSTAVSRKARKGRQEKHPRPEWIYTIGDDGVLVCTDPVTGAWYRVPENTVTLGATGSRLTIKVNGNLPSLSYFSTVFIDGIRESPPRASWFDPLADIYMPRLDGPYPLKYVSRPVELRDVLQTVVSMAREFVGLFY